MTFPGPFGVSPAQGPDGQVSVALLLMIGSGAGEGQVARSSVVETQAELVGNIIQKSPLTKKGAHLQLRRQPVTAQSPHEV
jgi:hypothetical protein